MEEIHTQEMQKRKEMQLRYLNLFDVIHISFIAPSLNLYMNIKQQPLLLQHAHTHTHADGRFSVLTFLKRNIWLKVLQF